VVAVEDGAGVELDQVTFTQHHVASRDPVHDLLVDRRAQRRWEAAVTLEGRHRTVVADLALGDGVEVGGRDARTDGLVQHLMQPGDDGAGLCHQLELGR
jgi:hypothetical protein